MRVLSGMKAFDLIAFYNFAFFLELFVNLDSVGLWINGLVSLAETVQGGEMDALVSLLREKVYIFGCMLMFYILHKMQELRLHTELEEAAMELKSMQNV
jgi:hypothetical protein